MSNGAAKAERGALGIFKFLTWIVYALAIVAIIVLGFGFALLLFGAKPVGFAETIYSLGEDFLNPFKGMIAPTPVGNGLVSWNALIAIAAYAVLAWVLGMILDAISRAIYRTRRRETPPAAPASASAAPPQPAPTSAQPAAVETPSSADAPGPESAPAPENPAQQPPAAS